MSRIRVLPDELASQVAAGEVVERPASVVKELVENSLDAGAGRVEVRVDRGGISLIRVVDDGEGMVRDDALLSLERHATSKLSDRSDLGTVGTFGFRGEALPSIASVSRFRLHSRLRDAIAGVEIKVSGGKIQGVGDSGEAPGTLVEVRNLFFNVPARRKFLRTEQTEAAHIEQNLIALAIGNPTVGMTYVRDGKVVFRFPPAGSLRDRLGEIWGNNTCGDLLEIEDAVAGAIRVDGFIGAPRIQRTGKAMHHVFVNGRPVESREIQIGIRQGYGTALAKGRHPVLALFVDVPKSEVDVNVHPAKREVRFRRPSEIQSAISEIVERALQSDGTGSRTPSWQNGAKPEHVEQNSEDEPQPAPEYTDVQAIAPDAGVGTAPEPLEALRPTAATPDLTSGFGRGGEDSPQTDGIPADYSLLAKHSEKYLLIECAEGLVIVDLVHARQRIIFEKMLEQISGEGVHGQRLLMPPVLDFSPRESDWIRENLETLDRCGVSLEEFGANTFKLDSLPSYFEAADPERVIAALLDDLRSGRGIGRNKGLEDAEIAGAVAKRSAHPGNWDLRQARQWLADLMRCEMPYCNPDGQPTMIQLSHGELEKRFS